MKTSRKFELVKEQEEIKEELKHPEQDGGL